MTNKIYRVVKLRFDDGTTYGSMCFRTEEAALREVSESNHYFRSNNLERLAYVQELILFED